MALPASDFPDAAQVVRRHLQFEKELSEIEQAFLRVEREELAVLEAAKLEIDISYREERSFLASQLPGQMSMPATFETFLVEKRNHELAKKEDDYQRRKTQREEQLEKDKIQHLYKWKALLLSPERNSLGQPPLEPTSHVSSSADNPALTTTRQAEKAPVAPAFSRPGVIFMPRSQPVDGVPAQPPVLPSHRPLPVIQGPESNPLLRAPNPAAIIIGSTPPSAPRRTPLPDRSPARFGPVGGRDESASAIANSPQPITQATERPEVATVGEQAPALPDSITVSSPFRKPGSSEAPNGTPNGQNPATPTGREPLSDLAGRAINQLSSDTQPSKRKAEDSIESNSKRSRVMDEQGESVGGSANRGSPQGPKRTGRKTISFDEVYQNGNAQYKHIIVEYPPQSASFYILRCEEHGVHFNLNPLAGAAKHLHSAQHGNMTKERAQAVELLGYFIPNCTSALAEKNNEAVRAAFANGYKPLNLNQLSKSSRISMGLPPEPPGPVAPKAPRSDNRPTANQSMPVSGGSPRRTFSGITNPIPGQLYLCYWAKDRRNYLVIVLPWGSLEPAGLNGSLAGTGLLASTPKCYDVNHMTRQIQGWAPGYQEGGSHVNKREFPVYYFDDKHSVGWVPARDLSEFSFESPNLVEIPFVGMALTHFAKTRGFEDWSEMRNLGAGRDLRTLHRSQLSGPVAQATSEGDTTPMPGVVSSTSRAEDHEMRDAPAAQADDSDRDSVSRIMTDSENEVGLTNTESRRTSVSNRGELQGEARDKNPAPSGVAQPIPSGLALPPIQANIQHSDSATSKTSSVSDNSERSPLAQPNLAAKASLVNQAQLIAAKALQIPAPMRSPQEAEFHRNISKSQEPTSHQGSAPSADHVHRRVEKIYAHSNPNRASKSPGLSAASLPEKRQNPVTIVPRIMNPGGLHNILQSQPSNGNPPRPGPLSQQGFLAEPERVQNSPSPLQQPVQSPGLSTQRAPVPRVLSPALPRLPSPLHILPSNGPGAAQQQPGRSSSQPINLISNPPSRTPTPVVVSGHEASLSERWRAVRTASQPIPSGPPSPPARASQPTPAPRPGPILVPHSRLESPRDSQPVRSPLTPSLSATSSPLLKSEYQPAKSNDVFDVAIFPMKEEMRTDGGKPGDVFRLIVDNETKIAKSSPEASEAVVVDPRAVKQVVVEAAGSGTARAVKVVMDDDTERTFVFEPTDTGFGIQSGSVHARRFCRWITTTNPSVDYQNNSTFR